MGIVSQQSPKYQPTRPSDLPDRVNMATVRIIVMARRPAWAACMAFLILLRESSWSFIWGIVLGSGNMQGKPH